MSLRVWEISGVKAPKSYLFSLIVTSSLLVIYSPFYAGTIFLMTRRRVDQRLVLTVDIVNGVAIG